MIVCFINIFTKRYHYYYFDLQRNRVYEIPKNWNTFFWTGRKHLLTTNTRNWNDALSKLQDVHLPTLGKRAVRQDCGGMPVRSRARRAEATLPIRCNLSTRIKMLLPASPSRNRIFYIERTSETKNYERDGDTDRFWRIYACYTRGFCCPPT